MDVPPMRQARHREHDGKLPVNCGYHTANPCGKTAVSLILAGCQDMHITKYSYCMKHLDNFREHGSSLYTCTCGAHLIEYVYKHRDGTHFHPSEHWGSFRL